VGSEIDGDIFSSVYACPWPLADRVFIDKRFFH
jgi:hypothetical protein